MKKLIYWYPAEYNIGDTLTPHIINHFRPDIEIERAGPQHTGKLLAVGSIMKHVKAGDTVFGTGIMRKTDRFPQSKDVRFLAVRGPLTREILIKSGGTVPEVYGDPALLLPLMYSPVYKKTHKVGYVPHYVDKDIVTKNVSFRDENLFIDVALPWRKFIDKVLACEYIISSSLHGIIIANAYGIPAQWVEYSDKVIGQGFKFRDYGLSIGMSSPQVNNTFSTIHNLSTIQEGLLHSLSTI